MASITFDGHSLLLDGRRLFIVSGTVLASGIPRGRWPVVLHRAARAGLNTVLLPVVWSRHETAPGRFDFEGDRDVAAFVRLAQSSGLHVILRVGPVVERGLDLGGMPPWLMSDLPAESHLRTGDPAFLAACSRWISALGAELAPLQATHSGAPGPIIAVQSEHRWFCGSQEQASAYLGVLQRYIREAGFNVPVLECNNLDAAAEGSIECWSGAHELHAVARQLHAAKPDQPAIVLDLDAAPVPAWGDADEQPADEQLVHAVAEALAGGAQINLANFCRGTRPGFLGGRIDGRGEAFAIQGSAGGDLVDAAGLARPALLRLRRLLTFASSFARLLAGAEAEDAGAVLAPSVFGEGAQPGITIDQRRGPQGTAIFVFAGGVKASKRRSAVLTLADGSQVRHEIGAEPVAWTLANAHLIGRARLDSCSLTPYCLVGRTFVCFGPAGTTCRISINGSPAEIRVPTGKRPAIEEIEGITVVVCSETHVDQLDVTPTRVCIGVRGSAVDGTPVSATAATTCTAIDAEGRQTTVEAVSLPTTPRRSPIGDWAAAPQTVFTSGESVHYIGIDGPADLAALGAPTGYAWLRVTFRGGPRGRTATIAVPESGDRLHLWPNGAEPMVLGVGPQAAGRVVQMPIAAGEQTWSILADNLGRPGAAPHLREPKGLAGHVLELKPIKAGRARLETVTPIAPLDVVPGLVGVHESDGTDPRRVTWSFVHRRKSALVLVADPVDHLVVVVLNDEPIAVVGAGRGLCERIDESRLRRGKNVVQLAVVASEDAADAALQELTRSGKLHEAVAELTAGAAWAFAAWAPPEPTTYEPMTKTALAGAPGRKLRGGPAWWRGTFTPSRTDVPAFLELTGLSKGHVLLDGHDLGRYWLATSAGKRVGPQTRMLLPTDLLTAKSPVTLEIFDEHGFTPEKCAVCYAPAL